MKRTKRTTRALIPLDMAAVIFTTLGFLIGSGLVMLLAGVVVRL